MIVHTHKVGLSVPVVSMSSSSSSSYPLSRDNSRITETTVVKFGNHTTSNHVSQRRWRLMCSSTSSKQLECWTSTKHCKHCIKHERPQTVTDIMGLHYVAYSSSVLRVL